MYKKQLFLGFLVEPDAAIPADLIKGLTDNGPDEDSLYLSNVNIEGRSYLGKSVGEICDLASLNLLEKNILSLHKQLLPSNSSTPTLMLLTLENSNHG